MGNHPGQIDWIEDSEAKGFVSHDETDEEHFLRMDRKYYGDLEPHERREAFDGCGVGAVDLP